MTQEEKTEFIYNTSKQVYEKEITKNDGVKLLVDVIKMKYNSAMIVIPLFTKMMNGEELKRTLSAPLFEFWLSRILSDYGPEKLATVLSALDWHIDYVSKRGDSKIQLKAICKYYTEKIKETENIFNQDEKEQNEIIGLLEKTKSKDEVINHLINLNEKEPEIILINSKHYKRDNKTIAEIKFVRDSKCQICGTYILKKDGSKYIEAAHIIPKSLKGQELLDNIILLCPNHHKEFDLGKCKTNKISKYIVEIILNETTYIVNLAFK